MSTILNGNKPGHSIFISLFDKLPLRYITEVRDSCLLTTSKSLFYVSLHSPNFVSWLDDQHIGRKQTQIFKVTISTEPISWSIYGHG